MREEVLMALFKSGNPALSEKTFAAVPQALVDDDVMTLQGTVNRAAVLLAALALAGLYTWTRFTSTGDIGSLLPFLLVGVFGGLIVGLVIVLKKTTAPYLAIVYAVLEGLVLGALSAVTDAEYPGLAFEAFLLTMGIFGVLLLVYTLRIIRPSQNFRLIVASATGGIAVFYLISLGMSFFGLRAPLIYDTSWLGIGFSLVVVVIAALNLVVDFDFIEQGAANRLPRYMEWYAAFGLLVTLVWLYIELLRLLTKLSSRR
jgi:uncharacterized YccA/Bax inhibitor family protein